MKRFLTIQKHNAKRAGLHYDLRIQDDSEEKNRRSWVIKKARLPDATEKLLCINVSDHPWSYRTFEGTLESGYGAHMKLTRKIIIGRGFLVPHPDLLGFPGLISTQPFCKLFFGV